MRASDLVFFASGACALVYQTVWARLLGRVLGSDAGGVAVVLATFMAGLALGAALGGPLAARAGRPVRVYVALEVGIGLWAALTPLLFGLLDPIDSWGGRVAVAAGVLLVPTTLMGATFPLMGRLTVRDAGELGPRTAAFYGANTLGAAAGALLGPFLFMPVLGLTGAVLAAAAGEFGVALAAAYLLAGPPRAARPAVGAHPRWWGERLAWAAFLLGAVGLALEVLLTRLVVTLTGASIYALSIVLFVFLAGIGLGSRWLDGKHGPRTSLHRAALYIAPATLAGLWALELATGEGDLFAGVANRMPSADAAGIVRLWVGHAVLAACALLPPAYALGRALPSAVAAAAARHGRRDPEHVLAAIYTFNTVGALVGALAAAFLLLPGLGLRTSLGLVLAAAWVAALLVAPPRAVGVGALAVAGLLALPVLAPRAPGDRVVVDLAHGAHATVAVEDVRDPAGVTVRSLRIHGKVVATTAPVDLRLQRLLAHVPALEHGAVRRALVIGMGTGMTAGALLAHPELEELRVVEISPQVAAHGAAHFASWNGALLDDPRTEVVFADGRHHLARDGGGWDLVTSDPIHPWTAGSSDLYALEHFERMRERLAPGGIASQWLPLYQLSTEDVRTVVATWAAAFPACEAWLSAYDMVLVGAREELPGPGHVAGLTLPPGVVASLAEAGVHSGPELAALWVGGTDDLTAFAAGTPPMRDDRPVLEFRAPRSYLAGYSVEALRWAGRPEVVAELPAASRARGREVRAALDGFLERLPTGLSAAAERYGRELLALPPVPGGARGTLDDR